MDVGLGGEGEEEEANGRAEDAGEAGAEPGFLWDGVRVGGGVGEGAGDEIVADVVVLLGG